MKKKASKIAIDAINDGLFPEILPNTKIIFDVKVHAWTAKVSKKIIISIKF